MKHLSSRINTIVGEVLHYVWDPIGVAGVPQARGEYDAFVDGVVSLLESGAVGELIRDHLIRIAEEEGN